MTSLEQHPGSAGAGDGAGTAGAGPDIDRRLDASATWKPYIVSYEVTKAMGEMPLGAVVEVLTKDDQGVLKDLEAWCEASGNELLSSGRPREGLASSHVRKGEPKANDKMMTVVLSTASLEHVVFPLDKALAGAVLGMSVNVVFEGAGVRLLKRGYRSKLSGVIGGLFTSKVEGVMRNDIGWPLPARAVQILEELGANFYVCGPSMSAYGVREDELVVKRYKVGAVVTWADLLGRSDIQVFSKAQFEKP